MRLRGLGGWLTGFSGVPGGKVGLGERGARGDGYPEASMIVRQTFDLCDIFRTTQDHLQTLHIPSTYAETDWGATL